jgi:hypothetical protein
MNRARFLRIILFSSLFRVVVLLVTVVCAAGLAATTLSMAGENGSYLPVSNNLLVTDKGFSKASSTQTASGTSCPGSPVTFGGSPSVANTNITSNDIVFDAQSNTTSITPGNTCFTVTFIIFTSATSRSTYGPVYIITGATVTAGQTIDCKFDIGSSLPLSPFSFEVTVK